MAVGVPAHAEQTYPDCTVTITIQSRFWGEWSSISSDLLLSVSLFWPVMSQQPAVPVRAEVAKLNLRNPFVAGILAFLVPGLGHLYQRRLFKAGLYAVCILSTFFTGLSIGHGQVVYFQWSAPESRTFAYLCQFWVGLPALPALAQAKFRSNQVFDEGYLSHSLDVECVGTLDGVDGPVRGRLTVNADAGGGGRLPVGQFRGTALQGGREIRLEGTLTNCTFDPQVGPSPRRGVLGYFESGGGPQGRFEGSFSRPIWDWYGAPLFDVDSSRANSLDRAHSELGSRFELGVVYTMIAGLLNLLAIFDAIYGPAYGDDESTTSGQQSDQRRDSVGAT